MKNLTPSRIFGAIFVLAIVLILAAAAYQLMPKPSAEDLLEATVAAGVAERSTEIANLTGTPNPTQIQETVNAIVEATLNPASPTPPLSATEQVAEGAEGAVTWLWAFILGIWNFMGFAGIYSQICCCLLPFILIIVGAAADKARPR
jgi:hypothetical protein